MERDLLIALSPGEGSPVPLGFCFHCLQLQLQEHWWGWPVVSVQVTRSCSWSDDLGMANDRFNCVQWWRDIRKPNGRLLFKSGGWETYSLYGPEHMLRSLIQQQRSRLCLDGWWFCHQAIIPQDALTLVCPILVSDVINRLVAWTQTLGVLLDSLLSQTLEVSTLPRIPYPESFYFSPAPLLPPES